MPEFSCNALRQPWVRVVVVIVVLAFAFALVLHGVDGAGVAAVLTAAALVIGTACRSISAAGSTPQEQ